MQIDRAAFVCAMDFVHIDKDLAGAFCRRGLAGHVIQPQHHVLGGHDDGLAVGGRQYVIGRHHQGAQFQLRLDGKRHMHCHLVTVKIRIERGTHQGVQLDCLALDQYRLECLDTEAVQGGRTVQHDRMLTDDLFEDIPDFRPLSLHQFFGSLDGRRQASPFQLAENEGFEQLQRHFLGQAALVQLQGRTYHYDGPSGIVHPLAQQVLAEAPLFALDHVGQGFQRQFVGAGDGSAAATVIQQGVNRFLQHALLVTHDNIRRIQVQQAFQAVVAIDYPAIQVVQVGGGKTPAVERDQWP